MKYDFTTLPKRAGHDAIAVDVLNDPNSSFYGSPKNGFSVIPMWVADMNFPAAPPILEAIRKRLEFPTFGYFGYSDEFYASIVRWQKNRFGIDVSRSDIGYENGVLGCLASVIRAVTEKGGAVFVHSPTYIGFLGVLRSLGCRIVTSDLLRDENGVWRINYEDTERVIAENDVRLAIFCSPHNPVGRVWEREEIVRFADICERHGTVIFSDEIWSDIVLDGNTHIPTHSVSPYAHTHTVTGYATSKTFNLAGMIGAYHLIFSKELADRVNAVSGMTHYNDMNVLSMHAMIGAWSEEGAEWTDELCEVLSENARFACDFMEARFPGVSFARPQGTYMLYLDLSEYLSSSHREQDEVLRAGWDVGVLWQDGRPFGFDHTIRMNLALPTATVKEAFDRLDRYVFHPEKGEKKMKTVSFKDKKLSALGFGAMRLPVTDGKDAQIDEEKTAQMVDYAIAHGVNYFDTAWGYHGGNSETVMGKVLAKYPRDSFCLASKFPGYSLSNMDKVQTIFEEQLKKCGVDHFDFYLFHNVCEMNIEQYLDPKYGIFEYLLEQKRLGRITHLGFSTHGTLETMKRFLDAYGDEMEFCQIQLNYLDYEFQKAKEKIGLLKERNIPVWVMEPVRGGKLVSLEKQFEDRLKALRPDEKTVNWAFRFLQSLPVAVTLSGMSDMEQLKENIALYEDVKPLDGEELDVLLGIAHEMTSRKSLPCTACRYCTTYCPMELNIPYLISMYNEHVFSGGGFIPAMALSSLPEDKKPSACLGCGACAEVCPQKIDIPAMMADFAEKSR